MTMYAPIARIMIRYIVGLFMGPEVAELLAGDHDIVNYAALLIGAVIAALNEYIYSLAVKHGWAT